MNINFDLIKYNNAMLNILRQLKVIYGIALKRNVLQIKYAHFKWTLWPSTKEIFFFIFQMQSF